MWGAPAAIMRYQEAVSKTKRDNLTGCVVRLHLQSKRRKTSKPSLQRLDSYRQIVERLHATGHCAPSAVTCERSALASRLLGSKGGVALEARIEQQATRHTWLQLLKSTGRITIITLETAACCQQRLLLAARYMSATLGTTRTNLLMQNMMQLIAEETLRQVLRVRSGLHEHACSREDGSDQSSAIEELFVFRRACKDSNSYWFGCCKKSWPGTK